MPHSALDLVEVNCRVAVHHALDVIVVVCHTLDHDVPKISVRDGFFHVHHLVANEGGTEEVFVQILPRHPGCGHDFRRLASNSLVYGCHMLGVQLRPCLLAMATDSGRSLPLLAHKVGCRFLRYQGQDGE